MTAPEQTLAAREEAVKTRIRQIKRERGAAILDGLPFDSGEFARLGAELDDIFAAKEEATRRMDAERPRILARRYQDELATYLAANERRLAGIDRADRGMEEAGAGLAIATAEAETMRTAFQRMSNLSRPGDYNEGPLTPASQAMRLASYVRMRLRAALGGALQWGPFSLMPQPGDASGDMSWRELEAKRGCSLEFLEKNAPRVPADEEE